jgi:micrococcal nuclease
MAKVLSVVDGTTVRVDLRGTETVVHLLGVATPPVTDDSRPILKRLGLEAMAFLKETTKSGWVYLEFPVGNQPQTEGGPIEVAMYGGTNSAMVNEKLVHEGFAVVNRKAATPLHAQLVKAEETARASQNGIWGEFEHGDGQSVASGKSNQGTYIGTVFQSSPRPSYVRVWIISFY